MTWRTYDLDPKTRALLEYAEKLTEAPALLEDADFEALRAAGWDDAGRYEATALVAFLNFSGRLEAAAGLPLDQVPDAARLPEAAPDA
jgi:alkylhydroperoxidase family enzyme